MQYILVVRCLFVCLKLKILVTAGPERLCFPGNINVLDLGYFVNGLGLLAPALIASRSSAFKGVRKVENRPKQTLDIKI